MKNLNYLMIHILHQIFKDILSISRKTWRTEKWCKCIHLEITELVLVNCNIVNNNYQHNSRFWYTFAPNRSFDQLLDIYPKNLKFLWIFHSEFLYIEVWFTDQNSKPLEIEDEVNIN